MHRSIGRRFTALSLCVVAALAGLSCVTPRIDPSIVKSRSVDSDSWALELVSTHNEERAKANLAPVAVAPILEAAAKEHAEDMAIRGRMSHRGGDGSSPFVRIKRHGYRFREAGENVAFGFDDVHSVMTGWMRSPGHRRNILGNFSEIGVGRAIATDGSFYWCVTFGIPESQRSSP